MKGVLEKITLVNVALFGLVAVLLLAAIFCGHAQIVNIHGSAVTAGRVCASSFYLAMPFSNRGAQLLLVSFIFAAIALAFIRERLSLSTNKIMPMELRYLCPPYFFFEIKYYLHQAFRRGILHGQIYNLSISAS